MGRARTLAEYRESAAKLYGDHADALLKLYPAENDEQARRAAVDAGRDATLGLQMRSWARAQALTGKSPVYVYFFSRVHPYVPGVTFADHDPRTVGAYHTGDVPYWLETLDALNLFHKTRDWTDLDRQLAESMSNALVAFASSGNPNTSGQSNWPRYRSDREEVRELGSSNHAVPWPDSAKMDFFAAQSAIQVRAATQPVPGRSRD